jgi:hypothetical protein
LSIYYEVDAVVGTKVREMTNTDIVLVFMEVNILMGKIVNRKTNKYIESDRSVCCLRQGDQRRPFQNHNMT